MFLEMTCANCHGIQGVTAVTNVAPDLTHLASRQMLGAGVVQNTPTELARWLHNPQAIKPSCRMPNLNLTASQVNDLVSYFETLR